MITATIQPDGQITLPAEWREKYGLKEGDTVKLIEIGNGLFILPNENDEDDLTPEDYAALKADLAQYMVNGVLDYKLLEADAIRHHSEKTYRP